ncbi:hypothetical protein [Nostoc sp.]
MNQFLDTGFVVEEALIFSPWQGFDDDFNEIPQIRLNGEIACLGKILITVDKYLNILEGSGNNAVVQTFSYAYNASIQGHGNIFRYDNQDDIFMFNLGHADEHHKHLFDWRVADQLGNVIWVGYEGWPKLDQIIREAESWYWENRSELFSPEQAAQIGKGRFATLPISDLQKFPPSSQF